MEFKASEVYSLVHWSTRMLGYFRIMAGFKVKINDVNEDSVSTECERGIQRSVEGKRGMIRELDLKQMKY